MALIDDLQNETDAIVRRKWERRDGTVVPEIGDLGLGNKAVDISATFLYADLANSTELVSYSQTIAAEVMKAYLMGTTRIIRSLGGEIRSFDGDRVMGVFIDSRKNTNAAKAGLQINYFFRNILCPAFARVYAATFPAKFDLKQTVGIDTSTVLIVRSGIRSNNDLVWVGRAPNVAAKLSAIRDEYSTYITKAVFDVMHDETKHNGNPKQLMWAGGTWNAGAAYGTADVYRSSWTWKP